MSALARLGSWAFDRGEVDRNVLDGITRVYHSDRTDKLWLPGHVDAFTRIASAEMHIALMLGMHTGQRQGDLRRLPWSTYDGERIVLRQGKSGKFVSIRCTRATGDAGRHGAEVAADPHDAERPRLDEAILQ